MGEYKQVLVECPVEFSSMGHGAIKKFVLEHRLVVAREIGRPLSKKEIVHHKNCNPCDNRVENLMLFKNHKDHARYHRYGKPEPVWRGDGLYIPDQPRSEQKKMTVYLPDDLYYRWKEYELYRLKKGSPVSFQEVAEFKIMQIVCKFDRRNDKGVPWDMDLPSRMHESTRRWRQHTAKIEENRLAVLQDDTA